MAEPVLLADGAGGTDEVDGAITVAGPVALEKDARQVVSTVSAHRLRLRYYPVWLRPMNVTCDDVRYGR